jgi:hypothetical protein
VGFDSSKNYRLKLINDIYRIKLQQMGGKQMPLKYATSKTVQFNEIITYKPFKINDEITEIGRKEESY